MDYDLIIKHGTIVDGTGAPRYEADLGVSGGKIAAIGQISGPALGSTAPEFHQEFAFDAIHQDLANLAATVDQFHQMASNSTLLH